MRVFVCDSTHTYTQTEAFLNILCTWYEYISIYSHIHKQDRKSG